MDFLFDYIHVNTFWTILLILHGLASVALLGALTHQAMAVLWPARAGQGDGIVVRFRAVSGRRYATAVCVLWVIAFLSFLIITSMMVAMQDSEAIASRQMVSRLWGRVVSSTRMAAMNRAARP